MKLASHDFVAATPTLPDLKRREDVEAIKAAHDNRDELAPRLSSFLPQDPSRVRRLSEKSADYCQADRRDTGRSPW